MKKLLAEPIMTARILKTDNPEALVYSPIPADRRAGMRISMKKITVLLLCLMLCLSLPVFAEKMAPEEYTSGDYIFNLLDDGTAQIIKYSGSDGALVVPATLDGYAVTAIGLMAFDSCPFLTQVTLPDSLTAIGDKAFADCNALTKITIPNSVTSVGMNPFYWCYNLSDIIVSPDHPVLATIDGVLFNKADKRLICYPCALKASSYSIPQGIQMIGGIAFSDCDTLTQITIPDSVTIIGHGAFFSCENLTQITIPSSVTNIEDRAFFSCSGLTQITIPDSVIAIGCEVFMGCTGLTQITIPDSVTTIGDRAFSDCVNLMTISLPDSVTSIGTNPFKNCINLSDIIVSPDHPMLATIDGVLFSKADKRLICYPCALKALSYSIPQGIRMIGGYAFSDNSNLTQITFPDSVTTIEDKAFFCCSDLTQIILPDSVTSIGAKAFYNCSSLAALILSDSVTSIGKAAFSSCNNDLTVTVVRDSYAAEYCKENGISYTYTDSLDWLNG